MARFSLGLYGTLLYSCVLWSLADVAMAVEDWGLALGITGSAVEACAVVISVMGDGWPREAMLAMWRVRWLESALAWCSTRWCGVAAVRRDARCGDAAGGEASDFRGFSPEFGPVMRRCGEAARCGDAAMRRCLR